MDKAFLSKFMQGRRKQEDIVKVFVGGKKSQLADGDYKRCERNFFTQKKNDIR